MDLAEDENFFYKHPYFFNNYTFKFEALTHEIQENVENIVKSMGAKVSDESQYVFTDISRTSLDQNKNYYSLSYLSNSILAEEPLDIEDYKFSDLVQGTNESGFCCMIGRYILKNKSCMRYVNENICCKICIERTGLLKKSNNQFFNQDNGETNNANIDDFNEEPNLHIEETNNLQFDKSIARGNDLPHVQHEISHINLNQNSNDAHIGDENHNASVQTLTNGISQDNEVNESNSDTHVGGEIHNASVQSLTNGISQDNEVNESNSDTHVGGENHKACNPLLTNSISQENGVNENNSDSSDLEIIEIKSNVKKPSCSRQGSKKRKTNKSSSIDRWKRVRTISSSSDERSEGSDIRNPTRKRNNKRQRLSSSTSVESKSNESSSTESKPHEKRNFIDKLEYSMNKQKWWLYLPTPKKNPNYKETKIKSQGRRRDYSYGEKRLMLAYLVVNDLIDDGTSRRPWRKMLVEGYLDGRTAESLNNHYRRVLLPGIEYYHLPKDIEKRFIDNRKLHLNRR